MAQIYFDCLGKNGALGMMSLLMIVQFLMGVSILVAASRQSWAFSRDGALPFSSFFRVISVKMGYIPVRTTIGCAFAAAVLGLLCLIAPAAAAALFSLAVVSSFPLAIISFLHVLMKDSASGRQQFSVGSPHLRATDLGRAKIQAWTILHRTSEQAARVGGDRVPDFWDLPLHVPGWGAGSNGADDELHCCYQYGGLGRRTGVLLC